MSSRGGNDRGWAKLDYVRQIMQAIILLILLTKEESKEEGRMESCCQPNPEFKRKKKNKKDALGGVLLKSEWTLKDKHHYLE